MGLSPTAILHDLAGNALKSIQDGSDYLLGIAAKIRNAAGTIVNPATEDTLALIKNTDGIKKITDALPVGDNRVGRVKVTDDTNLLGIDAQNHAYVAGKSLVGVAPSAAPVSVSGVDGGGLKRIPLLDTAGRAQDNIAQWLGSTAPTVGQKPRAESIPVAIASDQIPIPVTFVVPGGVALPKMLTLFYNASIGAIVASVYRRAYSYTVPAGYNGYVIRYTSFQAETALSRLVAEINFGTLNIASNVFMAGASYAAPQWSGICQAEVTTGLSAGAGNVTVTVTYTNESGVGSRTGTITIPKGSALGSRWDLAMQAGDLGVLSVQSMSVSPTLAAGVIKLLGFIQLTYHEDGGATQLETLYAPGGITFPEGTVLGMEFAGGVVSKARRLDTLVQLTQAIT